MKILPTGCFEVDDEAFETGVPVSPLEKTYNFSFRIKCDFGGSNEKPWPRYGKIARLASDNSFEPKN